MNRLQKIESSPKKILLEYSFVVSVAFNSFVHADTKIWKFEGRKKIFRDHISTDYCQQVSSINNSKHQITLEVMASVARPAVAPSNATFKDKEKPQEVRKANILAARAVSDAIRTSLGPKGMDKMIRTKMEKSLYQTMEQPF